MRVVVQMVSMGQLLFLLWLFTVFDESKHVYSNCQKSRQCAIIGDVYNTVDVYM